MAIYRQGDVLLRSVESVDPTAHEVMEFVLAEGEVTGHCHVARGQILVHESIEEQQGQVLTFLATVEITHEEHGPLTVPAGTYEVVRERERDWLQDAVRRVSD